MTQRLFGTDGVRGANGTFPVCEEGAYRFGRAAALVLAGEGRRVLVGRDTRPSGEGLSEALLAGLADGGSDTVDLGVVPTPAVAYHVAASGAAAGVAVSASHNPARDNGYKVFGAGGEKLPEAVEDRVEAAFGGGEMAPSRCPGRRQRRFGAAEEYVDFAVGTVPREVNLRGLRVAVDCARGATRVTTPLALERLGLEVVTTAAEDEGSRINEGCGSVHPDHVRTFARQHRAAVALAHDGDGDRLVMIDESGEVVGGDQILGLSAWELHQRGELSRGQVVGTIVSNLGLEQWLGARGLTFHRSEVGDRNVWKLMRRHGADLGGEPSGHTIFRRLSRTDDALLTALHVLSLMALSGRRLHDLASQIPLLPQETLNLLVTRKPALESLPAVTAALRRATATLGGRGRLVVRYSGTEPLARILAEGPDTAALSTVVGLVADAFELAGLAA